jgi:transcriptional regulator with XRE-family HTH domain
VDDLAFGRLIRLARIRRRWSQQDLAGRAGVSRTTVSRVERGYIAVIPLATVRTIAAPLEVRVELRPRARAVDLDQVMNARHSAMAEFLIAWISRTPGWVARPEVSFSRFGERGAIDLLAWHAGSRCLLVIEIKTELVEFGELLARLDMKRRLAPDAAAPFGWRPSGVSTCLLVADSMTNRRGAAERRSLLGAALPDTGAELLRWLRHPTGVVHTLRFVSDVRAGHVRDAFASPRRVRKRGIGAGGPRARSR